MTNRSPNFDQVAGIIADLQDTPLSDIKPSRHLRTNLEIDSLDFVDVIFAVERELKIDFPLSEYTRLILEGKMPEGDLFIMSNFVQRIDKLIDASQTRNPDAAREALLNRYNENPGRPAPQRFATESEKFGR